LFSLFSSFSLVFSYRGGNQRENEKQIGKNGHDKKEKERMREREEKKREKIRGI